MEAASYESLPSRNILSAKEMLQRLIKGTEKGLDESERSDFLNYVRVLPAIEPHSKSSGGSTLSLIQTGVWL